MNLTEFKKAHKAAGGHFFDKATMEFFNSRVESRLIGGKYFITSEQFEDMPRGFKVRVIDPDDPRSVETLEPELRGPHKNWDGSFLRSDHARQYVQDVIDGKIWAVQGYYAGVWEDVTYADTEQAAREDYKDYVNNESGAFRVRRVSKSN